MPLLRLTDLVSAREKASQRRRYTTHFSKLFAGVVPAPRCCRTSRFPVQFCDVALLRPIRRSRRSDLSNGGRIDRCLRWTIVEEVSALPNEGVCLTHGPSLHNAVMVLLSCVDFSVRGYASQRTQRRVCLSGDESLQAPKANEVAEASRDIHVVAIHRREQQGVVVCKLETQEA